MALKNRVLGENVFVYKGTDPIGCAKTIELNISVTELDVTCQGTGDVMQTESGRKKITGTITGLDRMATGADAATNVTADNLFDDTLNGTSVTVKWGSEVSADIIYTAVGIITSWKVSGSLDSVGTFDVSFAFNSITKSTIA
jgi:hypothetical protein